MVVSTMPMKAGRLKPFLKRLISLSKKDLCSATTGLKRGLGISHSFDTKQDLSNSEHGIERRIDNITFAKTNVEQKI